MLLALQHFLKECAPVENIWIAYSGGVDSHVLLSLCHQLNSDELKKCRVIHIHHGLHPDADGWSEHCQQICDGLSIPLHIKKLNITKLPGESLEEKARTARYEYFSSLLKKNDLLITAHHQDDQAETLLLQLCRGAGPKGLSAMPVIKTLGQGQHGRPLLAFSRKIILAYAKKKKLQWIDDTSNENLKLTRNFFRHQIIPLLQTRWENITIQLARSANHCADYEVLLDEYVKEKLHGFIDDKMNFNITHLSQFSQKMQKILLRKWITLAGFPLPSEKILQHIFMNVILARKDKNPYITWKNVILRKYRQDLYLSFQPTSDNHSLRYEWDFSQPLFIPSIGFFDVKSTFGKGLRLNIKKVTIQFRQAGDKVILFGRKGRRSLKKLFQTWGVPPWERDNIPLIFFQDFLIGALDYFWDQHFMVNEKEWGMLLVRDHANNC